MSARSKKSRTPSPRRRGVYGKTSSSTSEEITADEPSTESSFEKISEITESSEEIESPKKVIELGEKPTSEHMIKRFKAYIEESRGGVKFLDGDTMETNIYSEFIIDDLIFFYDVYNPKKPYTRFANIKHLLISRVAPDPEETLHITKGANVERRFHIPGHKSNAKNDDVVKYIGNFFTPDGKTSFKAKNDVPYEPFTRGFIDRYHNDYTEQKPIIINPNDILVYVDVYKDYFFHFDQKNLIPSVFIGDDVRDNPNDNDELFYYRSEVENRIPAYRPIEIIGGVYKLSEDFLPVSINAALRDVLRYLETICFQLRIDWEQKQIAIKEKTESLIKTASKQLTKSELLKEQLTKRSEKKKKQKESILKKTLMKEVLPSELGGRKQPQEEFAETRKTMKGGVPKGKSRRFEADEPVEMAEEFILPTKTTISMEEIAISPGVKSKERSPLKSTIRTSQIGSVKKPSGVTFKREPTEELVASATKRSPIKQVSPTKKRTQVSPIKKRTGRLSTAELVESAKKSALITEVEPIKKKRQYKKRIEKSTAELVASATKSSVRKEVSPTKKRTEQIPGRKSTAELVESAKKSALLAEGEPIKKKRQYKKRISKVSSKKSTSELVASAKKSSPRKQVSPIKKRTGRLSTAELVESAKKSALITEVEPIKKKRQYKKSPKA